MRPPPGGAQDDCCGRAGKRDGDERSSPAEQLRAYLESECTCSEKRQHRQCVLKQEGQANASVSGLMSQKLVNQSTLAQSSIHFVPSFISSRFTVAIGTIQGMKGNSKQSETTWCFDWFRKGQKRRGQSITSLLSTLVATLQIMLSGEEKRKKRPNTAQKNTEAHLYPMHSCT